MTEQIREQALRRLSVSADRRRAALVSPRKARRLPSDSPSKPRRAKRPGPAAAPAEDAARLGPPRVEQWPDGDWVVRQVPGAAATKTYRCPGCDQELVPGTAHLLVWPVDGSGADERRHWHVACWQRRPRRPGPGLQTHR